MEITVDRLLATIGSLYVEISALRAEYEKVRAENHRLRADADPPADSPQQPRANGKDVHPAQPAG
jgi:regulator of replication initiation timing